METPEDFDSVLNDVDMIHESQPTHPIRSRAINWHPRIRRTAAQIAAGISVQAIREQRNLAYQSRQAAETAAHAAQAAANAALTASNATENSIIANEQANRAAAKAQTSVDQAVETARFIDARAAEQLLAIERASRATQVDVTIEEPPSPPCPAVHPERIEHYSDETHGVVLRRSQRLAEQDQWRSEQQLISDTPESPLPDPMDMSNFAFALSTISSDPNTYRQAMKTDNSTLWQEACDQEMNVYLKIPTFSYRILPPGRRLCRRDGYSERKILPGNRSALKHDG
ncbi:hypothetical protein CFO_g5437 [Ceratocystis platani]|uniref:Uncharacterized protein n=1 Tax=Ceratocystis fimbriata f. sp. platani TaxID=88771 RepID=A0A0F8AZB2_CERFI|nr:hypothetical protein CFO_g5437 [Ceratocystis platani]